MKYFINLLVILCILSCNTNNDLIKSQTYFDKEKTKLESEGDIEKTTQLKEGQWKFYTPKGELAKSGNYKNGKQTGTWEYFLPNKQKGELVDGKKEGLWKSFDKDGNLSSIVNYVNDQKIGKCESYYKDGSLMTESYYKNDKLNGPYIYFNQRNGDTTLYTTYINDQRDGLFKKYADGKPYVVGYWKPNIGFVGEVRHYRNETLVEIEYKDDHGKTISKETFY